MRRVTYSLESVSPYSPSRMLTSEQTQKQKGEEWEDAEKRYWRERAHVTPEGEVFIPPMAFKFAVDASAKYLNETIRPLHGA